MGFFKTLGCYPPEYNPKVHGPYIPFRNYGPKDTPLGEVKVGDLKAWLARRDKSPRAIFASLFRARKLWEYKWVRPYNASGACFAQFITFTCTLFYLSSFSYQRSHKNRKYH